MNQPAATHLLPGSACAPGARRLKLGLLLGALCTFALGTQVCSANRVAGTPGPGAVHVPGAIAAVSDPKATQVPVFDAQRIRLTSDYSTQHYGSSSYWLIDPQMVVVHYTAIPDLRQTLHFFQPALLDPEARKDIASGGEVNVSAHYVIGCNGELYQLAPEDVICRHTIGFNSTAIGIENVAADADHLGDRQAQATAGLISRIVARHPSIRYLIGHHEYRDSALPHYRLLLEQDPSYRFTDKMDPGPLFMARVRQLLKEFYGITLSD